MATDSSRNSSRRKPTRRSAARSAGTADSHYSKLTRRSGATPSSRQQSRRGDVETSRGSSRKKAAKGSAAPSQRATNYESLTSDARRRVYGNRKPKRRQGNASALLIAIALIAGLALSGYLFWTHRAVQLKVNGESQRIRIGSTLEHVRSKLDIVTKPGDYITVSGNVIEKDKGYAFSAIIDGKELSHEDTEAYRIKGGEDLQIVDGGDRMEEYDVSYRETQPKLVFEGSYGAVAFIKQWGQVGRQEVRTGKDSGETADGEWVDELRDCIVVYKNITPEGGKKLVALTFDDGPATTYTEAYLDILKEKGVKATFFNLSSNELNYPELAKKVVSSGNQIASHTNQHLDLTTLGQDELLSEISSARETIKQITGVDTTIIRPPYGSFTQSCWLKTQGTLSVSVLWNQDTVDWSQPGVDAIVEGAISLVQPGSIILMHDGGGNREQDLEALPQIIDRLQASGYELVTLNELLDSDPDIPDEIAAGNATMPEGAVWPTEIGEATTSVG